MTRKIWLATAAVALAGVIAIPVMAQPPQGRGAGRGAGMGMGPGGPGGGRGGPMGMLRGVDLTEAQRAQIKTIHESARGGDTPRVDVMELQKQLHLAILADSVDAPKVEELKVALANAEAVALAKRIDVETRIAQILTAEQRAKARQALEQGRQNARRR